MLEHIYSSMSSTTLGIWCIEESEEMLSTRISINDLRSVEGFHPHKKAEFLATRQLMTNLCEKQNIDYQGIRKDEYGKPFLIGVDLHISVAHAYPYVTCLINRNEPCGIDIETPREQLLKIKHKFLNESELDRCGTNLDMLCLHWCAKEALYKIYGRKNLTFINHLFVKDIADDALDCEVSVGDHFTKHKLKHFKHSGHCIVYNE